VRELPSGWAWTTLGEVAEIGPSLDRTSIDPETPVSFVPMAAVEAGNGVLDPSNVRTWREVFKGYVPFAEGDVLFARITPCMENGKVAIALGLSNGVGAGSTEFHVVRARQAVDPKFLLHYLLQERVRRDARAEMQGAAGQMRVPGSFLSARLLALPPSAEQSRIVASVERQLSHLDAALASLTLAEAKLAAASRSLLQRTCEPSGSDTRELVIADVAECLDSRRVPVNAKEREKRVGAVPYYGANGRVGWIDNALFNEPLVLVVEDETFVARTKPFAYKVDGPSWVNNHVHILRPNTSVSLDYLHYALMYYPFTPMTTGSTGRRKLTQKALMAAPVYIPSPNEQHRVVESFDRWFSIAEQLSKSIDAAKQRAARLRQSILQKAFEGKLVPQDPNDEPASILLERIRANPPAGRRKAPLSGRAKLLPSRI